MKPTQIDELLKRPIAWKSWHTDPTARRLLSSLQANIVKGHGREHTRNLFWNFQGANQPELRATVRRIGRTMPSALDQLQATETFKATGLSGGPVLCFFLRPNGYAALGAADKAPANPAYVAGMQARGPEAAVTPPINDPKLSDWQPEFQGAIDAMLLVAAESEDEVDHSANRWGSCRVPGW